MASEYSKLRNNIIRQQKRLLNRGYHSDSIYIPPTETELGRTGTQEDIEELKNIIQDILNNYRLDVSDSYSGDTKILSYDEARKYERQKAYKKGQVTKILHETEDYDEDYDEEDYDEDYDEEDDDESWADIPDDEDETIVFTKEELSNYDSVYKRILELNFFISEAKNYNRKKHNEEIVHDIGSKLQEAFERADISDHIGLIKRLSYNALDVNQALDRAKQAYLEKDNGVALTSRLINIILGRNLSIEEAKDLDSGFDEPVETDEYGEVIE